MSNNADIKLDTGGHGNPKESASQPTLEARRYGTLAMADFRLDDAIANTYPELIAVVRQEIGSEDPGYTEVAARTSTAAAAQAIQGAIADQRPEIN